MARFKSFLLVSLLFGLSMFTSSAQTDDFYAQYEKFRKYVTYTDIDRHIYG